MSEGLNTNVVSEDFAIGTTIISCCNSRFQRMEYRMLLEGLPSTAIGAIIRCWSTKSYWVGCQQFVKGLKQLLEDLPAFELLPAVGDAPTRYCHLLREVAVNY